MTEKIGTIALGVAALMGIIRKLDSPLLREAGER